MHDFLLDEALATRYIVERLKSSSRDDPGPGMRFATDAEQGVDDLAAAWADSQGALEAPR